MRCSSNPDATVIEFPNGVANSVNANARLFDPTAPLRASTINGERHYLWRAVDQDSNILDIFGPAAMGQARRQEIHPEGTQGPRLRATGDHHGQAQELRRCQGRDAAWRGAPPAPVSQ
jgi:hypothetical protein